MIDDFDAFEKYFDTILTTKFPDVTDRSIAFSHPIYTPKKTKQQLLEILFEKEEAHEVYLGY